MKEINYPSGERTAFEPPTGPAPVEAGLKTKRRTQPSIHFFPQNRRRRFRGKKVWVSYTGVVVKFSLQTGTGPVEAWRMKLYVLQVDWQRNRQHQLVVPQFDDFIFYQNFYWVVQAQESVVAAIERANASVGGDPQGRLRLRPKPTNQVCFGRSLILPNVSDELETSLTIIGPFCNTVLKHKAQELGSQ